MNPNNLTSSEAANLEAFLEKERERDVYSEKVATGVELSSVVKGKMDPKIPTVYMTPDQERIFQMFIGLGGERSVPKLHMACAAADIRISEATLKRWCASFKWYDLAERTDRDIAKGIADAAIPSHAERMRNDLLAMAQLKRKFYEQVENDEIRITTLAEYIQVLKAEALVLGDPTERTEHTTVTRLETELTLTPKQLDMVMKLTAAQEFGLPPEEPETIEGETT